MFDIIRLGISTLKQLMKPYLCPVCGLYSGTPVCHECAGKMESVLPFPEHFVMQPTEKTSRIASSGVVSDGPEYFGSSQKSYERWLCSQIEANAGLLPCRSMYWMKGATREIIHAFKYAGRGDLAGWLVEHCIRRDELLILEVVDGVDVICCVPSSSHKRKIRNYEPTEELAKYLARRTRRSVSTKAIIREDGSESQTQKTKAERLLALKAAFSVTDDRSIRDRNVLLIDDVCTTGSTMASCAMSLVEAGARTVTALAIARTPRSSLQDRQELVQAP